MCYFPAICLSIAPSFPRRGPLFQSVGHVVGKTVFLRRLVMSSVWCLAEIGIETFRINNVTPENDLRVRLHPGRKTISYGRDIFFMARKDFSIVVRLGLPFGKVPTCLGLSPHDTVLPLVPVYFHDGASNAPTASHDDFSKEQPPRCGSRVEVRSSSWAFSNISVSETMAVGHDLSSPET